MKKPFLICAVIVAIFSCAILILNPSYADILYDEDNLIENLTVAILGIALGVSLILLFIRYKIRSGYGFWLFFTILLFIFVGDEISWGIKHLGFTKHKIAGIGFDGIHDTLSISVGTVKVVRDYIRSIGILDIRSVSIIIGSALAIIILAYLLIKKLFLKNRERIYKFFSRNLKWEPFLFLVIGLILILVAAVIDDDNLVGFPHKEVVEESLELIASMSFLFSCLSGFKGKR